MQNNIENEANDFESEIEIEHPRNERPAPPRRRRPRLISPTRVTLLENQADFDHLVERLLSECQPQTVQQEGDLLALAQLRWRMERLDLIHNQTLNWQIAHGQIPVDSVSNEERLMFAYNSCAINDSFLEAQRQHLAVIKTMHVLGARVEKWNRAPKTPAKGRK